MSERRHERILIVGAGPGGLTAAMILAKRGFDVEVFERQPEVGGRNANLQLGEFKFDLGPTFLMMKPVLEEVFHEAGATADQLLDFQRLEPMYRLQFADRRIETTSDPELMKQQIAQAFPGKEDAFDRFIAGETKRFERLYPCLQRPYHKLSSFLSTELIRAVPHLSLGKSLYQNLFAYFEDPALTLAFTFQAKYLGMSPWECPALFSIIPFIEYHYGVYHVRGGICQVSHKMAEVATAHGAKIHLNTPVKKLLIEHRKVTGVELENGERIQGDQVILNADFAQAMCDLVPPGILRKYSPAKLEKKRFSCSTFMLYLGVDKIYDMPHHTIVFADDYRRNVEEVFQAKSLSSDISFYVRNASVTDSTLAPDGKSGIYVLVPAPNLRGDIDWNAESAAFREHVLDMIEAKTIMTDLRRHIEVEKVITPQDWRDDYNVYAGATFNLAHNLTQMTYLRPRNKFEELDNCYLVGGGTHPGSGLPTIYESGRIAANLIARGYQERFLRTPQA